MKSVGGCFPGIGESLYADLICMAYRQCRSDFVQWQKDFKSIGGSPKSDDTGPSYVLTQGWDDVADAESVLASQDRAENGFTIRYSGLGFSAANIVFLAAGVFGIVLTGAGLLSNILWRKPPEALKQRPELSFDDIRIGGLVVVFVGAFGFLVYDSAFLARISSKIGTRSQFVMPGSGSIVWACALVTSIVGGLIVLLIIAQILLAVFTDLPHIAVIVFWGALLFLPIAPVVAGSIGSDAALLASGTYTDINWIHGSYINKSGPWKNYFNTLVSHSPSAHTLRYPGKSRRSAVTGDVWDICGPDDDWFDDVLNSGPGVFDAVDRVVASMTKSGVNPPWSYSLGVYYPSFLTWGMLYSSASMIACHGTTADKASVQAARSKKDMCRLRLASAERCAPGWSKGLIEFDLCSTFSQCVDDVSSGISRWEKLKAVRGSSGIAYWTLPVGWNEMRTADAILRSEASAQKTDWLLTDKRYWAVFNITLSGIVAAGWLLITIGFTASLALSLRAPGRDVPRDGSSASLHMGLFYTE
jgi:hypothetical protein